MEILSYYSHSAMAPSSGRASSSSTFTDELRVRPHDSDEEEFLRSATLYTSHQEYLEKKEKEKEKRKKREREKQARKGPMLTTSTLPIQHPVQHPGSQLHPRPRRSQGTRKQHARIACST